MNDVTSTVGPELSADETKFFETGGESGIPADGGGDTTTTTTTDSGAPADKGGDADAGKDAASKTVPLNALHEERTKRKALDQQLREAQQQIAEFKGRFSVIERLQGGQQQQTEQPAKAPTAQEDIFGAFDNATERLAKLEKANEEAAAASKAAAEHTTFVNSYKADAQKFIETNSDYMDAYNHLLGSRAAELQAIGYEGQDLANALQADEIAIARMAMSKGKSPAELLYGLAKQRGYTKKEAAAAAAPSGAEKLDAIERAQAANKSLSNTGGNSGDQDMTAERLLSMPIDDFEAWCEKNPAKARRIMGG